LYERKRQGTRVRVKVICTCRYKPPAEAQYEFSRPRLTEPELRPSGPAKKKCLFFRPAKELFYTSGNIN